MTHEHPEPAALANERPGGATTRRRTLLTAIAAVVAVIVAVGSIAIVPARAADHEPVQVVVKVRWGSSPAEVAADLDARLIDTLVGSRRVVLLETDDKDAKKAAKRLREDRRVVWVEENVVGTTPEGDRFHAWASESRPVSASRWQYLTQDADGDLDLDAAHRVSTGAGVRVAVLDTGVDAKHPALVGRVKRRLDVIDGDFRPDDVGNGVDDDDDGHVDEAVGHGTHVAGAILLAAPDAQILAYRVLDSDGRGTVFGVAEAIRHAVDAGADVINLSFGADKKFESNVLQEALAHAKRNDVLVIAAAGNRGSGQKRYPAADNEILAVGAFHADTGRLADFSSHGGWVDVAAPGVDITSTVPGGYATWSGSSMAAPWVSAEAALLLSADPTLSRNDLEKLIRDHTSKVHKGPKVDKGAIDVVRALDKATR